METVLYYNNYYFKLQKENKDIYRGNYEDLKLSIYNKDNELLKTYKVEYVYGFSYKILKNKIKTSNILYLFDSIDYEPSISKMFFNKLISQLEEGNED